MYLYSVELNGEVVGYFPDSTDYISDLGKDKELDQFVRQVISKMFNNMGFESEDEYFDMLMPGYKLDRKLRRSNVDNSIYYEATASKVMGQTFSVKISIDTIFSVNYNGSTTTYMMNFDRHIKQMAQEGHPCMFLVQPCINEMFGGR